MIKLKNGLTVILDHHPESKIMTIKYIIKAGSLNEQGSYKYKNNFGVAHLTEHLTLKGNTIKRTPLETNEDTAKIGATSNAYTCHAYTAYFITVLNENCYEALEILTDTVWHSVITDDNFNKEKQIVLEEIKSFYDDPEEKCISRLNSQINSEDSYKHVIGTLDSVQKLTMLKNLLINII